ncbi:MAG: ArnT family glycosyltransferase, partial [Candidatus Sulfotelmatobacter sp.]
MIRSVRELLRSKARFFLLAALAALALRLFLVWRFPAVVDDSRLYADIAKNWLQHGIYGITNSGQIVPTLARLPGYPAFLAAIFAVFGLDNFKAVLLIQVLLDLGTCFLIADMARRLFSARAAQAAFLLAGLCPFLANYAAAALTETLEIFFTTVALDFALRGLGLGEVSSPGRLNWVGCGLSVAAAILLRPDGGLLLAAIGAYLLWLLLKSWKRNRSAAEFVPHLATREVIFAGILVAVAALAPLIPWTLRNLHTLHRFQPLAPRYANDSDEFIMPGFNRWVKTWIADYVSVQEIYWPVPGSDIDFSRLPNRAFDSADERSQTAQLFAQYNEDHDMSPDLDARFG